MFKEIRIYAEVYEQGVFFLEEIKKIQKDLKLTKDLKNLNIKIIQPSKKILNDNSMISFLRNRKKFDLMLSIIDESEGTEREWPFLNVEFSTAVKTDDHELQRFDGAFWSIFSGVPYLKISLLNSNSQSAGSNYGGGQKISLNAIATLIRTSGIIFKHIEWPSINKSKYVDIDSDYPSCPNRKHILSNDSTIENELQNFLRTLFSRIRYLINKNYLKTPDKSIKLNFDLTNSKRLDFSPFFLKVKINRFGHGMDPEKGMLSFFRVLIDHNYNDKPPKLWAEIQIGRSSLKAQNSYNSLFDGLSNKNVLLKIVRNVKNIDSAVAINIFKMATNTDDLFKNSKTTIKNGISIITITNDSIINFLTNSSTSTITNIFIYADGIILSDQKRNTIVKIQWQRQIVVNFFKKLILKEKIPLRIIKMHKLNEDLVTFLSIRLLKRQFGLDIAAVSYPNAQGDRCFLIGNGKTARRIFIDIISYDSLKKTVFLQENKDNISNSKADIKKLQDIIYSKDKKRNILDMINTIKNSKMPSSSKFFIGIGGVLKETFPSLSDIDYIITFSYSSGKIQWTLAIVNLNIQKFVDKKFLKRNNNKLAGVISLPYDMYEIK